MLHTRDDEMLSFVAAVLRNEKNTKREEGLSRTRSTQKNEKCNDHRKKEKKQLLNVGHQMEHFPNSPDFTQGSICCFVLHRATETPHPHPPCTPPLRPQSAYCWGASERNLNFESKNPCRHRCRPGTGKLRDAEGEKQRSETAEHLPIPPVQTERFDPSIQIWARMRRPRMRLKP